MTVSSTTSRVVCAGNGSATEFPFGFKVNLPADLVVVYTDASGTDFTLSPTQYAASGFGNDAGGTVTYPLSGPPIAELTRLTIYRDVAVTQPTSLSNQGAMWPQVIEAALDRLTYVAQKVTDAVSRSLVISPTDSGQLNVLPNVKTRANAVLAFDGLGQPYAATLTGSLSGVASWLANNFLLAATSAANACAALQAGHLLGNNGWTGTNDFAAGRLKAPTRPTGDAGTDVATTAFVKTKVEAVIGGSVLRSYLAGLRLTNNSGTPNSRIDVAAGACADDGNIQMLVVAAGTIDCATVGANGLDAGALANTTWYHVFAIGKPDGTTSLLASTSTTSPALPSGYMLKRRIGSVRTDGSAHILPFVQNGDRFSWKTAIQDVVASNPGNSATLRTFSVPTGVRVAAWLGIELYQASSTNCAVIVTSPDVNDMAPGHTFVPLFTAHTLIAGAGLTFGAAEIYRHTDASAQLRTRCSAADGNTTLYMSTYGWIDRRGRDD